MQDIVTFFVLTFFPKAFEFEVFDFAAFLGADTGAFEVVAPDGRDWA